MDQLEEALQLKPEMILPDNFPDEAVAKAITQKKRTFEASGGIATERIRSLSTLGVDRISLGALTHTICPIDFGLDDQSDVQQI